MAQRLDQIPDTPANTGPVRLADIPEESKPIRLSDVPNVGMTIGEAAASAGRDVLGTAEALARAAASGVGSIYGGIIAVPLMAQEALEGGDPLEAGKAVLGGFQEMFTWEPFFSQTPRLERDLGHVMDWLRTWAGYSGEAGAKIASRIIPGMGALGTEQGQRLSQTISEASFDALMLGTLLVPLKSRKPVTKGGDMVPEAHTPSTGVTDALVAATVKKTPAAAQAAPDSSFYTSLNEAKLTIEKTRRGGPAETTAIESRRPVELAQEGGKGPSIGPVREPTEFARAILPEEKAMALEVRQPLIEQQKALSPLAPREPFKPYEGSLTTEPRQLELDFSRSYFDEGIEALNKPGFMRTAEEVRAAAFAENEIKRISNVGSRGQAGSIDPSVFTELIEKAIKGTLNFFRSSGKEGKPSAIPPASHYENYFDLPESYQKAARMDLPLEDVVAEMNRRIEAGNKPKDLPWMMKGLWTNATIARMYDNLVVKWAIDKTNEITKHYDRLGEALAIDERFQKGYGMTAHRYFKREKAGYFGSIEKLPARSQVKVLNTIIGFDDIQALKDAGLQWPTIEMLRNKGFNDAELKAYMEYAKFADHMYDLTNYGRALNGRAPVERIPGYMHHAYKGDFAIRIVDKDTGNVIYFSRAHTKAGAHWAANRVLRKLGEKEKLTNLVADVKRMENSTSIGSMMAAFEETLGMLNRNDRRTKLIEAYFMGIRGRMSQGLLRSSLDRHGIRGWIGEEGVHRFNYHKVLKMQDNYRKEVIEYVKNAEILNAVAKPLERFRPELSEKFPNSWEYIQQLINKTINKPTNNLEIVDKFINHMFDLVTAKQFGSHAPQNVIRFFRNMFTNLTIGFLKIPFLLANAFQPYKSGLDVIVAEWARMGKGDMFAALAKMDKETLLPSKENYAAIEWAIRNREIIPTLMESIDFIKDIKDFFTANFLTGRMTAQAIEGVGWLKGYILMLEFYRSAGMAENMARKAAADAAKHIMVNYGVPDRPHMFTNFGYLGEAISPFATFRNNQYGMLAIALRAIKENPGVVRKLAPMLTFTGTSIFMAGLRGAIGIVEVDALIHLINEIYSANTNEPEKLIPFSLTSTLLEKGFGDFWIFGGLSSSTKAIPGMEQGLDIGSSSTAPELSSLWSMPGINYMFDVGMDIATLTKMSLGKATIAEQMEFWKDIIPSQYHGFVEKAFTKAGMPVPDEWAQGKGSVRRDEEDWRARMLFGSRTLTEAKEREIPRIVRREEARLRPIKERTIDLAVDYIMDGKPMPPELFQNALEEGMMPTEFLQAIKEEMMARSMTGTERLQYGKDMSLNRLRRLQRIQELSGDNE